VKLSGQMGFESRGECSGRKDESQWGHIRPSMLMQGEMQPTDHSFAAGVLKLVTGAIRPQTIRRPPP